jgi:hypothetical protein
MCSYCPGILYGWTIPCSQGLVAGPGDLSVPTPHACIFQGYCAGDNECCVCMMVMEVWKDLSLSKRFCFVFTVSQFTGSYLVLLTVLLF